MRSDARHNAARLVDAALAVFAERGLGATLDEVAKRAGVSQGTLYNRFGGRDGLIDAVLPELLSAKLADALADARSQADSLSRFERFVTVACELQASDPAFCDVISSRFASSVQVQAFFSGTLDAAEEFITAGVSDGVLDPDLRAEDVQDLLLATAGILHERGAEGAPHVRRLVRYFLAGTRRR